MAKIDLPEMDSVLTKTELMQYFRALKKAFGEIARHLATDTGMLKSILKAEDRKQRTSKAAWCVRPLLWIGASVMYAAQRAVASTAQRCYTTYTPNNRPRPRRSEIDWDK